MVKTGLKLLFMFKYFQKHICFRYLTGKGENLFTCYLTKGLVVVCFFMETGLLQIYNFFSDPFFVAKDIIWNISS